MQTDSLGNPITADNPATAAAIDDFVMGFLRYQERAVNVLAAAEADPGCCLANAYAALVWMFAEAPDAAASAAGFLTKAEAAAPSATERERMTVAMARAWVDGDIPQLLAIGDEIAAAAPRDLAMVKLSQYHSFNRGDAPAMLRIAHAVHDTNADLAEMHGMRAFAYEQCHLLDEAETDARHALLLRESEPWAHHALAHVALGRGTIAEGRAFMTEMSRHWTGLNSFMSTHNWWHLALFALSQGDEAAVLDIYDNHVWGIVKEYSQDQIGAVSLLARMEAGGIDVGERWADVADYLAERAEDTVLPFLTMQYLYGLARAARPEADSLLAAVRLKADTAASFERAAWAEIALPACEGLVALARGDHAAALRGLGRALPRLTEIGGSHAQRDLFNILHLEALIGAEQWGRAQQVLEGRRTYEPNGVAVNRKLADVYETLGLPQEAEEARSRIRTPTLSKTGFD